MIHLKKHTCARTTSFSMESSLSFSMCDCIPQHTWLTHESVINQMTWIFDCDNTQTIHTVYSEVRVFFSFSFSSLDQKHRFVSSTFLPPFFCISTILLTILFLVNKIKFPHSTHTWQTHRKRQKKKHVSVSFLNSINFWSIRLLHTNISYARIIHILCIWLE